MLGTVNHTHHPKKDAILKGIQSSVEFPKKIQNLNVLRNKSCLLAPRFGGRALYMWTKGKTRVWVDRANVYVMNTKLPDYSKDGMLVIAELFKNDNSKWVVAFEDIIIHKGDHVYKTMDFTKRNELLQQFVSDLLKTADSSCDPGVFCVKPWYTPTVFIEKVRTISWEKKPEWVIVWGYDHKTHSGSYWFSKMKDLDTDDTYRISKCDDPNPDQYDLLNNDGEIIARACVRSLRLSKWLAGLEDGTRVKCRKVNGIDNPEPYCLV